MSPEDLVDTLAGMTLFSDLDRPQLEAVAHIFTQDAVPEGQRILRQGFAGSGFSVILEGEVAVRIDGEDRARLGKGDFFGEMSVLLGDAPVADVVAIRPVELLQLSGRDLEPFLIRHPVVMYRMLQAVARRLRSANRWRG